MKRQENNVCILPTANNLRAAFAASSENVQSIIVREFLKRHDLVAIRAVNLIALETVKNIPTTGDL